MSTPAPAKSPGVIATLRALGDGVIGGVQERVELFAIELQEEKLRVVRMLTWMCAAILLGTLALAFASVLLIVVFWETARVAVVAGLTLTYTAATVGIIVRWRRFAARRPRPFAGSIEELKEDRTWIRGRD